MPEGLNRYERALIWIVGTVAAVCACLIAIAFTYTACRWAVVQLGEGWK